MIGRARAYFLTEQTRFLEMERASLNLPDTLAPPYNDIIHAALMYFVPAP